MTKIKFLAVALALVSPLAIQAAPVGSSSERLRSDDSGDLEHYHHEYYSHSYVDPNYHDDQNSSMKDRISKRGRHGGKSNTGVSIALGGHRHHPK